MHQIIHIIPIGFEVDRIVKIFDDYKVNKVYLLYKKPGKVKTGELDAEKFMESVIKSLIGKGIAPPIIVETDIFDIRDVLSKVSQIIVKEKANGNIIYVNMSAASKPAAVASTLAAMYHNVHVYYVRAHKYNVENDNGIYTHGLTQVKDAEMEILSNFTIDIPKDAKLSFLVELYQKELDTGRKLTTNDIFRLICENKLKGFEDLKNYINNTNNKLIIEPDKRPMVSMRINKGLISDLVKNNYIIIEKKGRINHYSITDKGRYAACLSGNLS